MKVWEKFSAVLPAGLQPYADKVGHVIMGLIAGAAVTVVGYSEAAIPAAAILGVAKEVYDKKYGGTVDVWDAIATTAGGVVVYLGYTALTSL